MQHLNAYYLRWKCAVCKQVHTRKVKPDAKGYLYQQDNHDLERMGMTAKVVPYDAVLTLMEQIDLSCQAEDMRVEGELVR